MEKRFTESELSNLDGVTRTCSNAEYLNMSGRIINKDVHMGKATEAFVRWYYLRVQQKVTLLLVQ